MADLQLLVMFRAPGTTMLQPQCPPVRPGDAVEGELRLLPGRNYSCDKLSIHLMWKTFGKGNEDSSVLDTAVIRDVTCVANESASFPFSFVMPAGPVSYSGTVVSVMWLIKAAADIPWAIDPKVESEPITLLPAPTVGVVVANNYRGTRKQIVPVHNQGEKVAIPPLVLQAVKYGFVGFYFIGAAMVIAGGFYLGLIPLTVFCLFAFKRLFGNDVAQIRAGKITASIEPESAIAGDRVQLSLVVEGKPDAVWDRLTIDLVAREHAVRGSGSNKKTYREELARSNVVEKDNVRPSEGPLVYPIEIPVAAAPSFNSNYNTVQWVAEVKVAIANWPDFSDVVEITVLPS